MRRIVAVIALASVLMLMCPVFAGANSDAASEYTIEGHIYDSMTNEPLEGVDVTIFAENYITKWTDQTDVEGSFSIKITQNSKLLISFGYEGYTLSSAPDCIQEATDKLYTLDLTDIVPQNDVYDLTGENPIHYIKMSHTVGGITGIVTHKGLPVKDVQITVTDIGGSVIYSKTDENGVYNVECAAGKYTVSYAHKGLQEHVLHEVVVNSEKKVEKNIPMVATNKEIYPGIDGPHGMMIVGAIIAIALLVFVILIWSGIKNGKVKVKLENDTVDESELNELENL